ncbi:MAG: sulfatase-like hydrolase/transferase, partial [Thermoanaerobaculia bacterium]|nr:sulfatase-like hydrolase/transferase [Thermoanaerobaculia bacterium]
MSKRASRLALCGLLAWSLSCAPRAGEQSSSKSPVAGVRPNILLIVVDTLRADHLSAYGYARPTSPAIDALAARGVRFDRHCAQAPCTFPSMNSLLTSRPVETFFGQPQGDMSIPSGVTSVAE